MRTFFKQLFCKHKYDVKGTVEHDGYTTYFLECSNCGKRYILMNSALRYSKQIKSAFNMWKRKEIDIEFDEDKDA